MWSSLDNVLIMLCLCSETLAGFLAYYIESGLLSRIDKFPHNLFPDISPALFPFVLPNLPCASVKINQFLFLKHSLHVPLLALSS